MGQIKKLTSSAYRHVNLTVTGEKKVNLEYYLEVQKCTRVVDVAH